MPRFQDHYRTMASTLLLMAIILFQADIGSHVLVHESHQSPYLTQAEQHPDTEKQCHHTHSSPCQDGHNEGSTSGKNCHSHCCSNHIVYLAPPSAPVPFPPIADVEWQDLLDLGLASLAKEIEIPPQLS
jgi:hypothetical protein